MFLIENCLCSKIYQFSFQFYITYRIRLKYKHWQYQHIRDELNHQNGTVNISRHCKPTGIEICESKNTIQFWIQSQREKNETIFGMNLICLCTTVKWNVWNKDNYFTDLLIALWNSIMFRIWPALPFSSERSNSWSKCRNTLANAWWCVQIEMNGIRTAPL